MSALSEVAAFLAENPGIWSAKTIKKKSGIGAVESTIGRALKELAERPNSGFERLQIGVYDVGAGHPVVTAQPMPLDTVPGTSPAAAARDFLSVQDLITEATLRAPVTAPLAKKPGKRIITPEERQEAFRFYAQGDKTRQVAAKLNVGPATAQRLREDWVEILRQFWVEDARNSREQWAVYYGGPDPDNCAGFDTYDDEAEAREMVQWIRLGGVARRTVRESPWTAQ